jgi:hypothetical protein
MATLEYIVSVIGGGALFAFIMMLFCGIGTGPHEWRSLLTVTAIMFVVGLGLTAWALSN